MKPSEVREMGLREAEEKAAEFKAELAKERAMLASGTKPENPGKIRKLRRDIARIFTIVNERKKKGEKIIEKKEEKKKTEEKAEKKEAKQEKKTGEKKHAKEKEHKAEKETKKIIKETKKPAAKEAAKKKRS